VPYEWLQISRRTGHSRPAWTAEAVRRHHAADPADDSQKPGQGPTGPSVSHLGSAWSWCREKRKVWVPEVMPSSQGPRLAACGEHGSVRLSRRLGSNPPTLSEPFAMCDELSTNTALDTF
jgi:hypothetical protein